MKSTSPKIAFVLAIASAIFASCNTGESGGNPPDSSTPLSDNSCLQNGPEQFIVGRVDLIATPSTVGLIAIDRGETYWVPYFFQGTELTLHDTVYIQLKYGQIGTDSVVIATGITETGQPGALTGLSIDLRWLKGFSITPHGLFEHAAGGGSMHRPGHIVSTSSPSTKSITVVKNGEVLQAEPYQLVTIGFRAEDGSSGDTESAYVPATWVTVLNDLTKYYYLEFYDDANRVEGKRVLRSFSVDHVHPGHMDNITIRVQ